MKTQLTFLTAFVAGMAAMWILIPGDTRAANLGNQSVETHTLTKYDDILESSDGTAFEITSNASNASLWSSKSVIILGDKTAVANDPVGVSKLGTKSFTSTAGRVAGKSVSKNYGSGRYIKLDDGSIWKIDSIDRMDAMLWMFFDKITIIDGKKLEKTGIGGKVETASAKRIK